LASGPTARQSSRPFRTRAVRPGQSNLGRAPNRTISDDPNQSATALPCSPRWLPTCISPGLDFPAAQSTMQNVDIARTKTLHFHRRRNGTPGRVSCYGSASSLVHRAPMRLARITPGNDGESGRTAETAENGLRSGDCLAGQVDRNTIAVGRLIPPPRRARCEPLDTLVDQRGVDINRRAHLEDRKYQGRNCNSSLTRTYRSANATPAMGFEAIAQPPCPPQNVPTRAETDYRFAIKPSRHGFRAAEKLQCSPEPTCAEQKTSSHWGSRH
jgi:hypothetical protein